MFSRITRLSLPLTGISRSCNKSLHGVHRNYNSSYIYLNNRYISTLRPVLFSSQIPKGKRVESDRETTSDNYADQKENATSDTHENYSESKKNESSRNADTEERDKEQSDQKRKSTVFAKELILHSFANTRNKEKESFLECLRMYKSQLGRKRERVPFIYAALKYMEEFGVHKDLSVYKQIIDIFPKESMIPTNQFQTMYVHYPREQYCCTAVLEQMEDFGVIPDPEMESLLLNIFGQYGMPLEKYWKMMYWMPKFKNLNPWPVPNPLPNDILELAKLAMEKISSIDFSSSITIYDTNDIEDSIEKTWIVSATSPIQRELLLKHDKTKAIFVEGPFKIYVATKCVDYFQMRADADENRQFPDYDSDDVDKIKVSYIDRSTTDLILAPSVHEQMDGTYFAICATGTSMKDSLLSWVRFLQKENPVLGEIPIVFTLRNYSEENFYLTDGEKKQEKRLPGSESHTDSNKKIFDD